MWPFSRFKKALPSIIAASALVFSIAAKTEASVNIPVGSRIYSDFERLEVKGYLDSLMISTRPFGRAEAARLADEAAAKTDEAQDTRASVIAERLRRTAKGPFESDIYLKPAESLYSKVFYSEKTPFFANVNNRGDVFGQGLNLRAGLELEAGYGRTSFYINPEYRLTDGSSTGKLVEGYAQIKLGGAEILAGSDAMWWGSGSHGSLLMSDNARPLEMVKVTSEHPFVLPWFLKRIGLVKPTVFLARLEKDRDFPHANLVGMRLDLKPTPRFQLGLSRVFMFGGEGRSSLGFSDWLKVFTASDSAEHADSPINGNQLASIDASYVYVNRSHRLIPFSGVKLYTEWAAEDSSGKSKTPTGRANIYGAYIDEPFRISNTDLRVEWANTARNRQYGPSWYKHGIYTSGYTYYGRVIGHHMGSDAKDLYIRGSYYTASGAAVGVEADQERSGVHSAAPARREFLGVDASYPLNSALSISGGISVERVTGQGGVNTAAWTKLDWRF